MEVNEILKEHPEIGKYFEDKLKEHDKELLKKVKSRYENQLKLFKERTNNRYSKVFTNVANELRENLKKKDYILESLARYANTDEQEKVLKVLSDYDIGLRYGGSVGKSPQAVILDYKREKGIARVNRYGEFKIDEESADYDSKEEVKQALEDAIAEYSNENKKNYMEEKMNRTSIRRKHLTDILERARRRRAMESRTRRPARRRSSALESMRRRRATESRTRRPARRRTSALETLRRRRATESRTQRPARRRSSITEGRKHDLILENESLKRENLNLKRRTETGSKPSKFSKLRKLRKLRESRNRMTANKRGKSRRLLSSIQRKFNFLERKCRRLSVERDKLAKISLKYAIKEEAGKVLPENKKEKFLKEVYSGNIKNRTDFYTFLKESGIKFEKSDKKGKKVISEKKISKDGSDNVVKQPVKENKTYGPSKETLSLLERV